TRSKRACRDRIGARSHQNAWNRLGCIRGASGKGVAPSRHDEINLETRKLGRQLGEPIVFSLRISILDGDVLSFYVAKLEQSQSNSLGTGRIGRRVGPR